jgi:hypothetical protein
MKEELFVKRLVGRVLAITVIFATLTQGAQAQTVIPTTQISGFLCQQYGAIKTVVPAVAVLTGAGWMAVGLYRRHESLVTDLVRAGILAIGVGLLPTVAGALGIGAGCGS